MKLIPVKSDVALRGVLPVMLLLMDAAGIGHPGPADETPGPLRVVDVEAPRHGGAEGSPLESACRNWRLSDRDVARFFELSETYAQSPYSAFYQVPCSISGKIEAEGKAWDFVIDGGGTATWSHGNETRYFGCSAKACEPLVLMPTDLMDPE
ncbi:MAG: hypothetical protein L0H23_00345 [Luteimonas sp.]|nr:hypothetical protein [Luteimonas sp.]